MAKKKVKEPNVLDELKQLSGECLTPSEFSSYVIDYYMNPGDYGIDEDSEYYLAISLAYGDIQHAYHHYKSMF
jgi:hypothetical protein